MLRPRERRRPQMPNQLSPMVEQRIVAFALGHPGLGPGGSRAQLARPEWGGLMVSDRTASTRRCAGTAEHRAKRWRWSPATARRYEPPREPRARAAHRRSTRPGELVGMDCFFVGRLHGTKGPVWQITAIDSYSSFAWADLVVCPRPAGPTVEHTSALARRVAAELQAAGWHLERCSPTTATSSAATPSTARLPGRRRATPRSAPGAPRPTGTSNGCTARSSKNAGAPLRALPARPHSGLRRDLDSYLHDYNHDRAHHGTHHRRPTPSRPRLRCPQNGAEMSRNCRHNSESVQTRRRAACRSRAAT